MRRRVFGVAVVRVVVDVAVPVAALAVLQLLSFCVVRRAFLSLSFFLSRASLETPTIFPFSRRICCSTPFPTVSPDFGGHGRRVALSGANIPHYVRPAMRGFSYSERDSGAFLPT